MIKIDWGKKKQYWKLTIPVVMLLAALFLNVIACCSRRFCDWYTLHIFPIWTATYGRITGSFSFSVGEILLYFAVFLVVLLILWTVVHLLLYRLMPKKEGKLLKKYAVFMFWVFGIVCLIMTLNCFLLYQASPMQERYTVFQNKGKTEYGLEEIQILRNRIVCQANELAQKVARDEEGNPYYEGDMAAEAKKQMKQLGDIFPNLKGYYPNPKPLYTSDFFSQQYIMGYYFPFSMEANYNRKMCIINLPATMCHELSHVKGFILEDEANFISYLACSTSEDVFFRYSACLSVITYLDEDFYLAAGKDEAYYWSQPAIAEQVRADKKFLSEEAWEEVEENAIFDTEFVKEVSNTFTETTLTLNGVEDGKISYSRVVDLMLSYYDGILY